MSRNGLGIALGPMLLLVVLGSVMQAVVAGNYPVPREFQPRPGRPSLGGRRPVVPPVVPNTRSVRYPADRCACDEKRLDKLDENFADLLSRMTAQEAKSERSETTASRLGQALRQLKLELTQVTGENQRLSRQVRSLQSESSSLVTANRRMQGDNRRLTDERDRLRAALVARERAPTGPVPLREEQQPRSSVRELDDEVGNREAEMMEMGLFTPPTRPAAEAGPVPDSRRPFQRGGSAQVASSLLLLNRENEVLTRKIKELEGRMDDQSAVALDPFSRIQSARGPPSPATREMEDKISQLERLMLVALQGPSGQGSPVQSARLVPEPGKRPLDGPPQRGLPASPVSSRMSTVAENMDDEDLDALVNVVDRVQNKSPRKSAFSVASTYITKGADMEPKIIEFDHEYVNKGGDFKSATSTFVCEHPGFYYITFTVRSYDGKYLGVVLMKNEEPQTAVYADSSDRNIMQSQSVVLHLQAGDRVYLRHAPSDSFAIHSGDHRYITFSGFLLYRGN